MIRLAAVGDIHLGPDAHGHLRPALRHLSEHADVLLLAGDLTRHGTREEGRVVVSELAGVGVPIVAVLGNHDYHGDNQAELTLMLADVGVRVLEGDTAELEVGGQRLAVAGVKGFGGGFPGRCGTAFGEPEMKAFVRHSRDAADRLGDALGRADGDVVVALTHYAPVVDTLEGEPPEIFPFLGCYFLAEVIDAHRVSLAVHGHAHRGTEKGLTPGGIRVRNVAAPVLGSAYTVYCLGEPETDEDLACP
ncbi:MAG TPA: metallophosphoesterase [Mycobacteriales bacterium]|nr:metallophosphoesterase [Mycobacteriales bacterium]